MKYVLFVCTHNAGRSQIAQAFWNAYAPADVRAESAGQEPAATPWPEVVEVMREVGIDTSRERPKKLDLEMQLHADWAITLGCGGARTAPHTKSASRECSPTSPASSETRIRPTRSAPARTQSSNATTTCPSAPWCRRSPTAKPANASAKIAAMRWRGRRSEASGQVVAIRTPWSR